MDKRRSLVSPARNASGDRWELRPADLEFPLDPAGLGFRTTEELEPLDEVVGQERALRALEFGLGIRHRGYNVYVSGMTGAGKKQLVQRLLEARAGGEATPDDWAYVYNFDEPDCPLALRLPSGQGARLREALEQVIDRLRHDLPAALKAKDFDAERDRLAATFGQQSEALFNELAERARQLNTVIRRLPNGVLLFVPLKDGRPLEREDVERFSDEERVDIDRRQAELGERASELMARQQELARQLREEVRGIIVAFARRILDPLIARVKADHPGEPLAAWLDRVRGHLLDHLDRIQEDHKEETADLPTALRAAMERQDPWQEYRVNVVADNSHTRGAPVVVEISPTYKNLFGTIEHDVNLFGRVSTDFTHIKPGSLLRASGGYLVLDLEDALTEPLVWKQLKRTLKSGQLLTDVYEPLALLATTALKPQPIPIDTKVVALGSAELYYLLQVLDDDFRELFKVRADFGPETRRDDETQRAYARFVARQARAEGLPPFDAAAVAEVIRFGAREAAHQGKLSVEFGAVADLVREAGHGARRAGAAVVGAAHMRQALDERVYRSDRIAAKVRELIEEGTLRISLEGGRVGQVNGLSVWDLGDYRFGRPNRVTASVGVGQEGLVNIERESDLSGSTHDKGVLILEGYLRNRYARERPLALSASLTFEQSYGWVEGDSASSAELYCLLSALAGVPLRQDVAVTGSINQHGEVQAVGGVNEKVEGFFDVCRVRGLTGTQGMCIPRSNVRHLVLRPDVIDAVRAGRFHVWAIDTIDEGIELLTGTPAGDVDQEGTFHWLLDRRLQEILGALEEQPIPTLAPRVRLAPGVAEAFAAAAARGPRLTSGRPVRKPIRTWFPGRRTAMNDSPKNEPAACLTFNGQTAADLMTPNPVSVRETATMEEALALLVNKGVSAVPVINEAGRPVGVLSYSDLLVHERETALSSGRDVKSYGGLDLADRCRVREVMTPAVFAVQADAPAASVVEQLVGLNVHRVFVVDNAGILVGVITPLDVLRHLRSKPPAPPDTTPAPPVRPPTWGFEPW